MEKIINFDLINKYWCTRHKCFHIRKRNNKATKTYTLDKKTNTYISNKRVNTFDKCKEFGVKLTESEKINIEFHRIHKRNVKSLSKKEIIKPALNIN